MYLPFLLLDSMPLILVYYKHKSAGGVLLKIGTLGYNYSHEPDFVMERSEGTGCYLMLLVKSPAVFEIKGESFKVQKNSFVVFSPETPYRYYAQDGVYTDDWIYFNLDEAGRQRFAELEIPFDKVIHLGNMDEVSQLVHIMSCEHYSPDPHREEIEMHYSEIFLMKLSSLIRLNTLPRSQALADRKYWFTHLRNRLYTDPEAIEDVGTMARQMGMSRSGFQHLYKKIFGVNIMQDMTSARIEYAKQLLSTTNLRIKTISEKCGYTSEYSFMRRFKERTGKTPTEFRSI